MKQVTIPRLPGSFYWIFGSEPKASGGSINRRIELNDHCVYYNEAKNERQA